MCGENLGIQFNQSGVWGSPPRVRGKRMIGFGLPCLMRITPACAGKTPHALQKFSPFQDHPRVCGENLAVLTKLLFQLGSPPRVRGKRDYESKGNYTVGITPACAGKTLVYIAG